MQKSDLINNKKTSINPKIISEPSLFRSEALSEQVGQRYGPIRLAQPLENWIITLCTIIFVVLFLAFIFWGELPRRVSVIGITQPISGSLSIIAPSSGTIAKRLVDEGDFVELGQPLFEVSTERQGSVGEVTRLLSQQLQARKFALDNEERSRISQASERRAALLERVQNLDSQEVQLETEIELALKRKSLAEQTVEKFHNLQEMKFASAMQLQEKQETLIDLEGRLGTLKRSLSQLQSARLELKGQYRDIGSGLASDLIQLKQTKASLEQEIIENQNRRGLFVLASASGQVTALPYKVGQSIITGQVLATVVAESDHKKKSSELEIHLYVPSRTVGFIENGQTVHLRYQAFPYQKFGLQRGVITSIGNTPFAPNEIPSNIATTILSNAQQSALGLTNNEALYRVIVKPESQYVLAYGNKHFLKSGMSLDADIVQERRHIWEWLLEPARALRGF